MYKPNASRERKKKVLYSFLPKIITEIIDLRVQKNNKIVNIRSINKKYSQKRVHKCL